MYQDHLNTINAVADGNKDYLSKHCFWLWSYFSFYMSYIIISYFLTTVSDVLVHSGWAETGCEHNIYQTASSRVDNWSLEMEKIAVAWMLIVVIHPQKLSVVKKKCSKFTTWHRQIKGKKIHFRSLIKHIVFNKAPIQTLRRVRVINVKSHDSL